MSADDPTERDTAGGARYTDDSPAVDPHATDPADPGGTDSPKPPRTPRTGGALDAAAAAPTTPALTVNAGLASDANGADDDLLAPGDS